jgi:REP element-mobilizing transposase RayT
MSVIAHHLIFTGYGHWLPNDPRGSGSRDLRKELFEVLGPIHQGRKRVQPPRSQLRSFYKNATPLLKHPPLWFDEKARTVIAEAVRQVLRSRVYTCWAFAVMCNHMHLCIRKHRDLDEIIWSTVAEATARAARSHFDVPGDHRIWADRPYMVFLESPDDIRRVAAYIERNPEKEGLPRQAWDFVKPYDNWPFHKTPQRRENASG